MAKVLKKYSIQLQVVSQQPNKAAIAENTIKVFSICKKTIPIVFNKFVQVFKSYVKRWQYQNKKKNFLEHINHFVNSMNNRSLTRLEGVLCFSCFSMNCSCSPIVPNLGLSPIEMDVHSQYIPINYLKQKSAKLPSQASGITVGSLVRIQLPKAFGSASRQRYSEELFIVAQKLDSRNPVLFKLKDLSGEPLQQVWYAQQLALVKPAQ